MAKKDKLRVEIDEDSEIIVVDGVKFHFSVFQKFADPNPAKIYKFTRDGDVVVVTEHDEDEYVTFLKHELRAAENRAEDLARSRDSALELGTATKREMRELQKLEQQRVAQEEDND